VKQLHLILKKNSHNIEPAATLPGTVGSSEEWLGKYGTKE
jgi:hypothetical protein